MKTKTVLTHCTIRFVIICCAILTVSLFQPLAAGPQLGGDEIEGALRLTFNEDGMRMESWGSHWLTGEAQWWPQTYSDDKSCMIHYRNGGLYKYTAGYYDGSGMLCTMNSNISSTVNRRVWTGGSVELTMDTTYVSPNRGASYVFTISNKSAQVLTDVEFYHGQDTYLGGSDSGGGYWSSARQAIGVKKPNPANRADEIYQELSSTNPTSYRHASLGYYDVKLFVEQGNLGNILNTNYYIDNGYALQWNTPDLNPGEVWTIEAGEIFKVASDIVASTPDAQEIGVTTVVTGEVQNLGDVQTTIWLNALIDNTNWTAVIDGLTSYNLQPGTTSNVLINVTCPEVVSVGQQPTLTLQVSNYVHNLLRNTEMTAVYYDGVVLIENIHDGAEASYAGGSDFGGHPVGTYVTNVFTLTNAGPLSVTMTNYTLTGDTGQFSLSGLSVPLTLAAGETSDLEVVYYYNGLGSHAATLTLQDNKPWTPFVMNMEGYTWAISPDGGSDQGGIEVTITNGSLGSGADINQVMVGGVNAEVVDQGTNWVSFIIPPQLDNGCFVDIRVSSISKGTKTMVDCFYVNPTGSIYSVTPDFGYYTGGYQVVISGTNFCDGTLGDVTNVTLAGTVVSQVVSVAGSTQVVVIADYGTVGEGPVVVESFSHGRCEKSRAFTYIGPNIMVYGNNGRMSSDEPASIANGTDFDMGPIGATVPQTLIISNDNIAPLHITSVETGGVDVADFRVIEFPAETTQDAGQKLKIAFTPQSAGEKSAILILHNDTTNSPFRINVAGNGVNMDPFEGPRAGDQDVTLSQVYLGHYNAVRKVLIGKESAQIRNQAQNWMRFKTPPAKWTGPQDITLIMEDNSTNVLRAAYTYNRKGRIYGDITDDWTQWETLPDIPYPYMPRTSFWFMGVAAYDGYVMALGGTHTGLCKSATYAYDGFEWFDGPEIPQIWGGMSAVALDDTLYMIGGYSNTFHHGLSSRSMGATNYYGAWTFDGRDFRHYADFSTSYDPNYMGVGIAGGKVHAIGGCDAHYSSGLDIYRMTNILTLSGGQWVKNGGLGRNTYHVRCTTLSNLTYCIGGYGYLSDYSPMTNAYTFDGTTVTPIAGLPYPMGRMAVGTVSGRVYAAGGAPYYYNYRFSNNVYRLDPGGWTDVPSLQLPYGEGQFYGGVSTHDRFYAIGPTSYAYPKRTYGNGVSPTSSAVDGGITVTIRGTNLCHDASDLVSVRLAGIEASSIVSAENTQVVVVAAAAGGGHGDVEVSSSAFGRTVASNAFSYTGGAGCRVIGVNGEIIGPDREAFLDLGTDFDLVQQGSVWTNHLILTNDSGSSLTISGWTTNGSDNFSIDCPFALPKTFVDGETADINVVLSASTIGEISATLNIENDAVGSSNYLVNLAATVYGMSTNIGPFQGGQTLTITNTVMGNGSDISAVFFNTFAATISDQGSNWVTVVTPETEWDMTCNVAIWSESVGATILEDAYTYREDSWIGAINYSDGEWKEINGPADDVLDMRIGPDGALYACGYFTNLCDGTYVPSRVAKYQYGVWSPVGTNVMSGTTLSLEFMDTNLIVGGSFYQVDTNYFRHIAKYDGTDWVALFTNRIDDDVRTMQYDGTNLYLGGEFDYYGYTNVARWNGTTLVNMGNGITNDVYALKYHNGYLYAGTDGSSIGEFARWNGSSWQHLTPYLDDGVFALAAEGSHVYFGGYFTYEDAGPMAYVGQWNGAAVSSMGGGLSNRVMAMDTLHDGNIVAGYYQYGYVAGIPTVDNMAVWDGSGWVPCGNETAYYGNIDCLQAVYNGIYVGGDIRDASGGPISNCAFFAFGTTNSLSPSSGSCAGGTAVAIGGYNLGNGTAGDVYRVTIGGRDVASIDSVSATQIVVTTAPGSGGLGDVVVYTYDYGVITREDAYTYTGGAGLELVGLDGSVVASSDDANSLVGTHGWTHPGTTLTNVLTLDNPGDQALLISAVQTNGGDADLFDIELPARIEAGSSSNVVLRFSPTASGTFTASVAIENNTQGASSNFVLNLKLSGYTSTADKGPWDGEALMTISNGTLGSGSDISSVRVGGYTATIMAQGQNWVQFVMPIAASSSVEDIHITSDSIGESVIPNAYEYYKGRLWGYTNDWSRWEDKPNLPASLYYASAAVYNGKIYAHGGQSNVYSYTYGATNWEAEPGLPIKQVDSYYYSNRTLIVYGTNLMGVGGNIKYGNRLTNDCNYRYTGSDWVQAGDFPVYHQVYFGNAGIKDSTLYYFGSLYNTPSNMVGTTSPTGDWNYVFSGYPTMLRSQGAVTLSNRLFSLGGLRSTTVYSNIYEFNGTSWETNTIPGLPINMHSMGATVMDGDIYVMGGFDYGNYSYVNDITNAYRYKNGVWEGLPGIKYAKGGPGACTYHEQVYCIGGTYQSRQVYAYPQQWAHGGVLPTTGADTGGYQAVLYGTDLCDGTTGDIQQVTFGGVDASVLEVYGTTGILVQVLGGDRGLVDVEVLSTLCGTTLSPDAFTFTGKDIAVLGNDIPVTNGAEAIEANGTYLGTISLGQSVEQSFVITNAGEDTLTVHDITIGGSAATNFVVSGISYPFDLEPNTASNMTVTYTANDAGYNDAVVIITNNMAGAASSFEVNMRASCLSVSQAISSELGGGTLTITNGAVLGTGADITNVIFGTVNATPIAQGENWVQVIIPENSPGIVDLIIQSITYGETILSGVFTYIEAGVIYGSDFTWTEMPGLPAAFEYNVAFTLNDQLYSAGGYSADYSTNVYRFDGFTWHDSPGLPVAVMGGMGAVFNDGFYYIGGDSSGGIITNVYRFNGTNWTEVAGLPNAAAYGVAGVVDGKLAVAGGWDSGYSTLTNCYVFDGTNWTETLGLRSSRVLQGSAVSRGKLYAFGGQNSGASQTFNQYSFNGSAWSAEAGMPALLESMGGATLNQRNYSIGGANSANVTNTVFRYDGSNWSNVDSLPANRSAMGAAFWRGALYAIGGDVNSFNPQTNVWMLSDGGVSPISGYPAGGYNVTIHGTNLCGGTIEDIVSVTICGATADVLNVSGKTQVVVTAGSGPVGVGDVVITSLSYGEVAASDAFTYLRGRITLIGTNGVDIAESDPASTANGTDFGSMTVGTVAYTNTFGIRNTGIDALTLSDVQPAGQGAGSFTVTDFPTNTLLPGDTGQITVVCSSLGGDQLGQLAFRDNVSIDPSSPILGGYTVSVYNVRSYGTGPGIDTTPATLDYSVTYGAANPADQTFDVSNVGSDPLTFSNSITYASAGDSWLSFAPTGSTLLGIGGTATITSSVDISTVNVGTHTATISVWSATATNSPQHVRVTLVVTQTTQTISWSNPGTQTYTNETILDGTASSGLTPTYTVIGGPADVHTGSYPLYASYTSTGEVTIVASQSGNMNYLSAAPVTQTWEVTRAQGQIALTNLVQEYTGSEITVDVTTSPTGLTYEITYDGLPSGPTNVGTYEVIATLTDPLIYGGTTGTLEITRISQTIIFPAIPAQKTTNTVGLSATGGGSGNPIVFNILSGPGGITSLTNLTFADIGDVYVTADQAGGGNYNAAPTVTNLVRVFSVTPDNGPYAGGNTVTITNGNLGTITNIIVEANDYSPLQTGPNWVALTMPPATNPGLTDITLQTVEYGNILLTDAYSYNQPGSLYGSVLDWSLWQEVNGVNEGRRQLDAAALNGKLYAISGYGGSGYTTNVNVFDGTNWTDVAGLPEARGALSACEYSNHIYAIGGYNPGGKTNVYQFDGSAWTEVAGLPTGLFGVAACTYNGKLYSVGGYGEAIVTNVFVYDGSAWTEVAGLPAERSYMSVGMVNGQLIAAGGADDSSTRTNTYAFDGTSWTEVSGMPLGLSRAVYGVVTGQLYVAGGLSTGGTVTNTYRFDGTSWTAAPGMAVRIRDAGSAVLNGTLYGVSGRNQSYVIQTNAYRYPATVDYGATPSSGSWTGSYDVVIVGENLGDGGDITNVTLCDVVATVNSQTATRVWITAGASTAGQLGDVVVQSVAYGTTVRTNGFTYIAPTLSVLGTNGVAITSDGATSLSDGSKFYATQPNEAITYTFGLTNTGNDVLNISGWTTNEADADLFTVSTIPTPIAVGGETNFTVTYTPLAVGIHTAQVSIASDDPMSPFLFNLAGSCFEGSTNVGPYAGGNTLTITNGYFGTITNVLVGATSVSPLQSGDNWFTIELPAASQPGAVDFVVQTSDNGDTMLQNAYTYNYPGSLPDRLPAIVSLTNTWLNGTNGTIFLGAENSGFMGCSVSPAGDVNNDGFKDMLIGAEWADNRVSHAYVVYGKAGTYPVDTILTNTWLDGVNGMWMRGIPYQGFFGNAVSDAGDFDGDGIDDMMVGAFQFDANSQWHAGQAFVVYGKDGGLPSYIAANDSYMGTATNATKLGGSHRAGEAATSVSSAGDVNGDGLTDLLVGAPEVNPSAERGWAGETYLVYGTTNTLPNQVVLTNTWLNGVNGMIFAGAVTGDYSGEAVSSAGDVNGDGLDDFLIGARYADPDGRTSAGEVYLVYGGTNLAANVILTNTWFDGINGVLFAGAAANDWCGRSLSAAGDVNGDGLDDFLIGATGYDTDGGAGTNAGATYLVYGTTNGLPGTVTLTNTWFDGVNGVMLLGAATNDYSGVAVSSGDVNGDGLSDVLIGAGYADPDGLNGGGETYLIYGRNDLPAQITLNDTWLDGENGIILAGREFQCFAGNAVSGSGDYNADGYNDMLIGAEQLNPEGGTYLVYGLPTPVVPPAGSWTGTYTVIISGRNMSDSDVTNVTICGLTANIISQAQNRVWVTAAAAPAPIVGDVVVQSISYGETVRSNGFTYASGGQVVLGTNGTSIASGEATTLAKGNAFYATPFGTTLTNTFSITNSGNDILRIEPASLSDPTDFLINAPTAIDIGASSNLTVTYAPTAIGDHTAFVVFTNNTPDATFTFNLSGSCYMSTTNIGPYAGGNSITITNGTLGDGSDITNVLVGGVSATITGQGTDWVTITLPATGSDGVKDILIQSTTVGDTLLRDAYTYNPAGVIPVKLENLESWITLTNSWLDGINGVTLAGSVMTGRCGYSVSSAGDFNGDGYDDLLVGTDIQENGSTGEVYLVYGRGSQLPATVPLTNTWLDGSNGSMLLGSAGNDHTGNAVSSAGDVNGDGFADLLIGAHGARPGGRDGAGAAYLIFGQSGGLPAAVTLTNTWLDGTNGITLAGAKAYDFCGTWVSSAGDVNGDGLDDLLIGAKQADPEGRDGAGETYLVYGRSNGFPATVIMTNTWLDGSNGTILGGGTAYDNSGNCVSSAGDVNGDGCDDILIGASRAEPGGHTKAGEAYLVYGRSNGLPAMVTLSSAWLDGTNGIIMKGAAADDECGCSVSSAGDMNGDGYDDMLIGARFADNNAGVNGAGETYLVFGRSGAFPASETMSSAWLDGTNGVILTGAKSYDYVGSAVSPAGDANGDGYPDMLVGAFRADPEGQDAAGETYLIYGGTNGLPATAIMTNSWLDGTNGIVLAGAEQNALSGSSVSSAGDVNGDGYADLLIGAYGDIGDVPESGVAYLVYGRSERYSVIPYNGSWTGGYPVAILGSNLGNGSDITNVTLCGVQATINSQTSSRVWITAGTASGTVLGDVRVYSVSFGETVSSNGFSYLSGEQTILGTNGASIASGETTSRAKGNCFYPTLFGTALTNTFSITNSGNDILSIDPSDLSDPTDFAIAGIPATVDIGGVSNFTVTYAPTTIGDHSAFVTFTNNTPDSPFTLNLAGSCYAMSTNNGPYVGGNTITITNGAIGDGMDITNVLVGGVAATINGQGTDWITIALPSTGSAGIKDILIQSTSIGDTILRDAYTYNPQGVISTNIPTSCFWTGNCPVVINGTDLCNGGLSDITSVTLAGVSATVDGVNGGTQILVTAAMSPATAGDVVVNSISHGITIHSNAFTYYEPIMTAIGTNGANIASGSAATSANGTDFGEVIVNLGSLTNTFSITNSGNTALNISGVSTTGTGAASFTLVGWPASIAIGGVEDFTVIFEPKGGGSKSAALNFANDGTNSPYVVNLAGYGSGGGIALASNILEFTANYAGSDPHWQSVQMDNVGVSSFTYSNVLVFSAGASNWLETWPNNGTVGIGGTTHLTNLVSISGLNAGHYTCEVQVVAIDATNSPQTVRATLMVAPLTQTVSFAQLPDMIITDTWGLSATGGASTNPVTFSVLSGPASIAGGTNLSFSNVGEVQIAANQAGDINHLPAPTVTNTLNVSPTTAEISTPTVSNILSKTADIGATIDTTNGTAVTERGVYWRVEGNTNVYSASQGGTFGDGAFSVNVTGLIAGVTNFYQVYAQNISGTVYTVESSFLARPDAPVVYPATATNTYSFSVLWDRAIGSTNYLVDVATDIGFSAILPAYNARVLGDIITLTVTGLTEGTDYYLRLRSENDTGISTNSATMQVTTYTEGAIGLTPSEFTFNAVYSGTNPAMQTCTVTNFGETAYVFTNEITYGGPITGWLTTLPLAEALGVHGTLVMTSSVDIATLNAGTYYATNAVVSPTATNSPQSVRVTLVVDLASQTITFPPIADQVITGLVGLAATGGASTNPVTFSVLSGPASIAGDTNLSFSNVGEVQIVANQAGDSNYYPAITVTNVFNVSPVQPAIDSPTVSNILSKTASLGATITSTNGAPVTERGVYWYTGLSTNLYQASEAGAFGNGAFSLNITGVIAGVTNFYQAYAENVSGRVFTAESSFLARPDAPELTGATNIQATAFYANWNAAIGATNYYIDVSETNDFSSFVPGYNDLLIGDANSVNVTGLGAVVYYYYRVRSENDTGISTNSGIWEVGLMMDLIINALPAEHDTPAPLGYGTNRVIVNTMVTNTVTTPAEESNGVRYACTGWSGTGDVPATGTANTVTFLFSVDSTLTWHWKTQYELTQSASGGTIDGLVDGWKDEGWIFDLVPIANNGYVFNRWRTNGVNAGTAKLLTIVADSPVAIEAIFTATAWDVDTQGTVTMTGYRLDTGSGLFYCTFRVCNPSGSSTVLRDRFLYAMDPDAMTFLNDPDGTSPTGKEYKDVTAEVKSKLQSVGNGDQVMDPGECVTLNEIAFWTRDPNFITSYFYSRGEPQMADRDTDGDGIPNSWEDQEGLNKNNPVDGGEDQDDDGVISEQEYIADTDPFDGHSFLHIYSITPDLISGEEIGWIGGTSVVQDLEWAPAMTGIWTRIQRFNPPTQTTNDWSNDPAQSPGFYRIKAVR